MENKGEGIEDKKVPVLLQETNPFYVIHMRVCVCVCVCVCV